MLDLAHGLWFPDPGLEQCCSFLQYGGLMYLEEKISKIQTFKIESQMFLLITYSFADNVILGALYLCVERLLRYGCTKTVAANTVYFGSYWKGISFPQVTHSFTCSHVRNSTFSKSIQFIAMICFLIWYAN